MAILWLELLRHIVEVGESWAYIIREWEPFHFSTLRLFDFPEWARDKTGIQSVILRKPS